MSQRDGFVGGLFTGAIFGSVVGGVLGALVVLRRNKMPSEEIQQLAPNEEANEKHGMRRQQVKLSDTESMETARRSLEDKIAQLNASVDQVRQQLGNVNSNGSILEPSLSLAGKCKDDVDCNDVPAAISTRSNRVGQQLDNVHRTPPSKGEAILALAGKYKDDPDFDDVVAAIEEYRKQVDDATNDNFSK